MPDLHHSLLAYIGLVDHHISAQFHHTQTFNNDLSPPNQKKKMKSYNGGGELYTICLVHIHPSFRSAQYIVDFLALHFLALEIPLVDEIFVGASPAFQPVLSRGEFISRRAARNG